jgi:hypothetical protein
MAVSLSSHILCRYSASLPDRRTAISSTIRSKKRTSSSRILGNIRGAFCQVVQRSISNRCRFVALCGVSIAVAPVPSSPCRPKPRTRSWRAPRASPATTRQALAAATVSRLDAQRRIFQTDRDINCSVQPDREACGVTHRSRDLSPTQDRQATAAHLHNLHPVVRASRASEAT